MKLLPYFLGVPILALTLATAAAQTDTTDATGAETPPAAGSTVITSDELHMDQIAHTSIFTGNVVVVGDNFNMKCEEMTVYFTTASKIDYIVAKGNVVIVQPDRITHCGQAIYYHEDDKFVLTDQPDILDNKNEISAPEIDIYRTTKKLITKGRSKTTIISNTSSSTNSTTTSSTVPLAQP